MPTSEFCHCPQCRPSIRPDMVTATPAELAAHFDYLRQLKAIGALPDPNYHPYPSSCFLQKTC
jgi:hypothetical protein